MGRLVNKSGMHAFLSRNIALRRSQIHPSQTCVEAFRTVDDRVGFCLQIFPTAGFRYDDDRILRLDVRVIGNSIWVRLDLNRWQAMLFFNSDIDEEDIDVDIEQDIPDYAKEFRRSLGSDNTLFDIALHDPPTKSQVVVLVRHIRCIQLMKQCGCGRASAISDGVIPCEFCVSCELTLTDTPDGVPDEDQCCLICLEPIAPAHMTVMSCCQAQLHQGCREEFQRRDSRCVHCRQ